MSLRSILLSLFFIICSHLLTAQNQPKSRLIVLTDIENEPDDSQSMVRLLLYANVIDIKGIIATTSIWKRNSVSPETLEKIIHAYANVQPNLLKHEAGFPEAQELLQKIKKGSAKYGMEGIGESHDSEGSDWIIKTLEENDERPLWISVWGGANTLAQALYKIEKTKSKADARKLISKLRVYTISDQDDSGHWIRSKFPELFYIVTPGDHYSNATWTAIHINVEGINNETVSNSWIAKNIQQGHGPLGAIYPDVSYGMEGDTPSWLSLIPNGLNTPEHPEWGGWGGRYELYKPELTENKPGVSGLAPKAETRAIWTNATDQYTPFVPNEFGRAVKVSDKTFSNNKVTLWRWRDDFQNDFAARMDWCTQAYAQTNHPPNVTLTHPDVLTVKSGQIIYLDAYASTDPDGDNFSYLWFHYPEAGSYKEAIKLNTAENIHGMNATAPRVTKKETTHFIVKVTDKGIPALSRYKRVIVNILPE